METKRIAMPAGFFSIAVGSLALANAWRVGVRIWHLPEAVAEGLTLAALAVWLVLVLAYAHKWLARREEALAELRHPVQSAFVSLGTLSSLLAAMALKPYAPVFATGLVAVVLAGQLALGVYLYGRSWMGGLKPELITPALYLPAVGQNFVAATASAVFGWPQLGALFFGAGLLSWLAIESVILKRQAGPEILSEALRPTLGIQLAPPVVGGVSYLALTSGTPDLFAQLLFGYGLYQALLLARMFPWIARQGFVPGLWGFSFGVAALPTVAMRLVERGLDGPAAWLAPPLFIAANLIIGTLAVRPLGQLFSGKLLPRQAMAATAPQAATQNA